MNVTPYLHFHGECEEALTFYAAALGGTIASLNRYAGSPLEGHFGEDYKNKVMHATLVAGDLTLMASDAGPEDEAAGPRVRVSLSLESKDRAAAERTFAALAEGGAITMPLQEVFWGGRFGMLSDRFGVAWMMSTI